VERNIVPMSSHYINPSQSSTNQHHHLIKKSLVIAMT